MSNRFETLFRLPNDLYCADSPVIVSAGVLLKDTESKRLVAQLKFRNLSVSELSALRVKLSVADSTGRHLTDLPEFLYTECLGNEEFGSNKAVPVPDSAARSFIVAALSAEFKDGSVWSSDTALAPLPQPITLKEALSDQELIKQYQMATNERAVYVPFTSMGLHYCTCGRYHRKPFCSVCGIAQEQALQAYDVPALTADCNRRLEEEEAARQEQMARDTAAREAAKQAQDYIKAQEAMLRAKSPKQYQRAQTLLLAMGDYRDSAALAEECTERMRLAAIEQMETAKSEKAFQSAKAAYLSVDGSEYAAEQAEHLYEAFSSRKQARGAKTKKTVKRICLTILLIAFLVGMVPVSQNYIIPAVKYSQADKMVQEARYDEAIAVFEGLGEYKDAEDRVKDTTYQKAVALMDARQYTEASRIFKNLKNYSDSRTKVKECAYLYGVELMQAHNYTEAIEQLQKSEGYSDAKTLINECYLTLAETEFAAGKYESALAYLKKIKNLDKNDELYVQCSYQVGLIKLSEGKFKDAVTLFDELGDYEDCPAKKQEAMYGYVTEHKSNKDTTTYKYLTALKEDGYKDSRNLYDEIYAWKIETVANHSSYDTVTNYSSLNGGQTCYIHFTISGGEPNGTLSIYSKIRYPAGNTETYDYGAVRDGDQYYYYFNSWGYYARGTVTFNIYDSNTNKVIATHKVRLT